MHTFMANAFFQLFAALLLVLLVFSFHALCDLEIDTIEGSSKDLKETKDPKGSRSGQSRQAGATGNATKKEFNCVSCDDIKDRKCQPWEKGSYIRNCFDDPRINPNKPIGCRKMIQKVDSNTYVSRHCTNLVQDSIQGCIERVGTKRIKVVYCHCRTSNCNLANRAIANTPMILITFALLTILLLHL